MHSCTKHPPPKSEASEKICAVRYVKMMTSDAPIPYFFAILLKFRVGACSVFYGRCWKFSGKVFIADNYLASVTARGHLLIWIIGCTTFERRSRYWESCANQHRSQIHYFYATLSYLLVWFHSHYTLFFLLEKCLFTVNSLRETIIFQMWIARAVSVLRFSNAQVGTTTHLAVCLGPGQPSVWQ